MAAIITHWSAHSRVKVSLPKKVIEATRELISCARFDKALLRPRLRMTIEMAEQCVLTGRKMNKSRIKWLLYILV